MIFKHKNHLFVKGYKKGKGCRLISAHIPSLSSASYKNAHTILIV